MKKLTFHCYNDPGHGWIKVKTDLLKSLGIYDNITTYSYVRGDYAYLEEDCDASTFIQELKKNGIEPIFKHHFTNRYSKIRGYENFNMERFSEKWS